MQEIKLSKIVRTAHDYQRELTRLEAMEADASSTQQQIDEYREIVECTAQMLDLMGEQVLDTIRLASI